jgi:alanine dehydrogenase
MNIGLLKEIKSFENRIMLVPNAVQELVEHGNTIYLESGAGNDSGYDDKSYESAGATILPSSEKVFGKSELILKIQAPMPVEYELFTEKHMCFCHLLPLNNPERLQSLLKSGATFFSGELIPPIYGGKGVLFSGACDIPGARVSVIGNNMSALAATKQALLLGATVNLICEDYQNLISFKATQFSDSLEVFEFDRGLLQNLLMETDVLIITGQNLDEKRNIHLKNDDLKLLEPGSLVIDLSLKNGDIIDSSRETKPDEPSYIQDGLVHFSVTNLPSFVSKTSSNILSNIISKYINQLTTMGFDESIATSPELRNSLVLYHGKIVNSLLAKNTESEHYDILELLELNI